MLTAFHTSHSLDTKGPSGAEKIYSSFTQNFYFPNAPVWIKVLCNDCITCQLNKPYPNQKQIAEKQNFKAQIFISITESLSILKDQYHHPQKETHL